MYTNYPNYQKYPIYNTQSYYPQYNKGNDDRFIPFLAPFLLGGLAGAAIAPALYRPYGVPCCPPYPPYYGQRPFIW